MTEGERLQKVLARAGIGSRRACEELIAEGRVTVNGRVAELGTRVTASDRVEVDEVEVSLETDLVHLVLHKPRGVITTVHDPEGRPTVMELVPDEPRVFPVGRLDQDTSGLLLLTNDGEFANRVMHPRYNIPKSYVAQVRGGLGPRHLKAIARGVELPDGRVRVDGVRLVDRQAGVTLVEVVVHEGRNRLVRRLFDELGFPVVELTRTRIGPIEIGRLKPKAWRKLGRPEVQALLRAGEQGEGSSGGP